MKTKFRLNVIIEGECNEQVLIDDLIRLFDENVVMYFPDDESVEPRGMEEAVFGITEVIKCTSVSKTSKEQL